MPSMSTLQKFNALRDVCASDTELDLILGKLLDLTLSQHRQRLERYERDLRNFEQQYSMDSSTFYQRFTAGELGDAMDLCEWAGLIELREDLLQKIHRLESVV